MILANNITADDCHEMQYVYYQLLARAVSRKSPAACHAPSGGFIGVLYASVCDFSLRMALAYERHDA